jgi:hypothetical protein
MATGAAIQPIERLRKDGIEASVAQALAKGDRLYIRTVGKDYSQQAWPNFETSCLRTAGSKSLVKEARLVTADRTP